MGSGSGYRVRVRVTVRGAFACRVFFTRAEECRLEPNHLLRVQIRVRVKSGLLAMTWHAIIQPNLTALVSRGLGLGSGLALGPALTLATTACCAPALYAMPSNAKVRQ